LNNNNNTVLLYLGLKPIILSYNQSYMLGKLLTNKADKYKIVFSKNESPHQSRTRLFLNGDYDSVDYVSDKSILNKQLKAIC
jgi:hypothetical protein